MKPTYFPTDPNIAPESNSRGGGYAVASLRMPTAARGLQESAPHPRANLSASGKIMTAVTLGGAL